MIEITTLFLALVFGPQRIDFDVSPDVAAVEIILDGERVERLHGPPWSTVVDLGPKLLAHRLEAVASDADGHEIDRTTRFVNLGHETHGGSLELLEGDDGQPEAVRLRWESIGQREPVQAQIYFNGAPLDFDDPRRVPLPHYEAEDFQFLSAELEFHDGTSRRSELGFGGRLGLEVSTQLTTAVVLPTGDHRPPKKRHLENGFRLRAGDTPLDVHGVEKGRAQVILVRDLGVDRAIDPLVRRLTGNFEHALRRHQALTRAGVDSLHELRVHSKALQEFAALPAKASVRLLAPRAALLRPDGVSPDMFEISPPLDVHQRGFLHGLVENPPVETEKHLAFAVALAGRMAKGSQRPRAVVLILGDDDVADLSEITIQAARAYLSDLGVPLFVWAFEPVPQNSAWGEIHSLGPADGAWETRKLFEDRVNELSKHLERQRLFWLRGSHLPREIELAPSVDERFRLAGRANATEPATGNQEQAP